MARSVYSTQLWAGILVAPTVETIPISAGFVVVVRDIDGVVSTDPLGGCLLTIGWGTTTWGVWTAPTNSYVGFQWTGRQVAPGPSNLVLQLAGTDAEVSLSISGYLLTA